MNKRKVRTVIDADGEALRMALAAEPTLASPNQREAEALVGQEFQTDEDFQAALLQLHSMGAANVLITLQTGCYALLHAGKGRQRMYRAWIPRVEAVSSVGSGDALLAGFVSGLAGRALGRGVPAAGAGLRRGQHPDGRRRRVRRPRRAQFARDGGGAGDPAAGGAGVLSRRESPSVRVGRLT